MYLPVCFKVSVGSDLIFWFVFRRYSLPILSGPRVTTVRKCSSYSPDSQTMPEYCHQLGENRFRPLPLHFSVNLALHITQVVLGLGLKTTSLNKLQINLEIFTLSFL